MSGVRQGGFSLLEVVIALAVLALALAALIGTSGNAASHAAHLRDRTLAHWVAMNVLTDYRLERPWPPIGRREGTAELAGRRWHWQATVAATPEPDMRRIDVRVRRADDPPDSSLTLLTGFAAKVLAEPPS